MLDVKEKANEKEESEINVLRTIGEYRIMDHKCNEDIVKEM
jgi:hypothetical protein